ATTTTATTTTSAEHGRPPGSPGGNGSRSSGWKDDRPACRNPSLVASCDTAAWELLMLAQVSHSMLALASDRSLWEPLARQRWPW
ncbi:unnamed protein product, partial [Polarella glacialis]